MTGCFFAEKRWVCSTLGHPVGVYTRRGNARRATRGVGRRCLNHLFIYLQIQENTLGQNLGLTYHHMPLTWASFTFWGFRFSCWLFSSIYALNFFFDVLSFKSAVYRIYFDVLKHFSDVMKFKREVLKYSFDIPKFGLDALRLNIEAPNIYSNV